MSLFKELYHKDVNKYTEQVQGLTYLSWAFAWSEVKKVDEKATAVIHEFPMLDNNFSPIAEGVTVPYLKTPEGYFVRVSVTINDHTETETLPVMDNKNVPLGTIAPVWVKNGNAKATKEFGATPMPTSFDINKSHKRCLVKAIAMHGLGLYIYAGEDVPEVDEAELKKKQEEAQAAEKAKKELEEADRKNFIKMMKELADSRPELAQKLSELEHQAKKAVDKFNLVLANRAYDIMNQRMIELEAVTN